MKKCLLIIIGLTFINLQLACIQYKNTVTEESFKTDTIDFICNKIQNGESYKITSMFIDGDSNPCDTLIISKFYNKYYAQYKSKTKELKKRDFKRLIDFEIELHKMKFGFIRCTNEEWYKIIYEKEVYEFLDEDCIEAMVRLVQRLGFEYKN